MAQKISSPQNSLFRFIIRSTFHKTKIEKPLNSFLEHGQVQTVHNVLAAALIGVACFGGALGMAHSVAKAANNMAEQPEAAGQIRTSMMMGLVFIETVIIYALIVAILIIFVL